MGARVSADDGPGVARRCVLFSPSSPCVLRRMILILVANDLVRASFEFLLYFRSPLLLHLRIRYKYTLQLDSRSP